jgi:methylated-DNA-protein-cysteine methyltransferase-like protein
LLNGKNGGQETKVASSISGNEQVKAKGQPVVNTTDSYRERVFQIVRKIPLGRVMTYGQLADILGEGYTARTVGYVMFGAGDEHQVPWQRVINSRGACSTGRVVIPPDKQQRLLEAEGIEFDRSGRCNLSIYRWSPDNTDSEEPQPTLFRT